MAPDRICTLPESGANRAGENRRHEQPDGGRGTIEDDVREASRRRLGRPEAHDRGRLLLHVEPAVAA